MNETKATTVLLCAGLAACAAEGVDANLDAGAPYRGAVDAGVVDLVVSPDLVPDLVPLPDLAPSPDLTPPDLMPPRCPDTPPDGGYNGTLCFPNAGDGWGDCWAVPTVTAPCYRWLSDGGAPKGQYAPSCAECRR